MIYARSGPRHTRRPGTTPGTAARPPAYGPGMKEGEAAVTQAKDAAAIRKRPAGATAGASVDFANGKEAEGVWITHEYAKKNGTYGMWVGKVFGKTFLDWYFAGGLGVEAQTRLDPGGSVELRATLRNGGDAAAPKAELRAVLVSANGSKAVIGSTAAGALRPGRAVPVLLTGHLPASTPAGRYRIQLVADPDNKTGEYSESNNDIFADRLVEITGPARASAAHDVARAAASPTSCDAAGSRRSHARPPAASR